VSALNDAQRASYIEQHRFLVWKAVRLVWPRVQKHVEKAELVSLGDLGLVEAAARFDPDAGVKFATFAWYRVQGSILDGLRRGAHLPRRVWAQLCALRAASEYLEAQARKEAAARTAGAAAPTDTEAKLAEVKDAVAAVEAVYATSMMSEFQEDLHSPRVTESPADAIELRSAKDRVMAAIQTLPAKERALVEKHYFEGKNLMEAGEELGISKSWASRLHAQAVERLRAQLARG
jgi:RNA polymerase sigma factor FliA